MRILHTFCCCIISLFTFGQIPDSILFDWSKSGNIRVSLPVKFIVVQKAESRGENPDEFSEYFQTLINTSTADSQLIIHFPAGEFQFTKTIFLKSNVTIEGEGSQKTRFIFNTKGKGNLFEISCGQQANFIAITDTVFCHSKQINNSKINLETGLYEILISGDGLATSDWAMSSIGQIISIDSIRDSLAILNSELKLDFWRYKDFRIRRIKPIENVHFKYFYLERRDVSSSQTNNFNFYYASNCTVEGIESFMTNMSHLNFNKSYRCRLANSYFHHAFSYGGGGKAYGVELSNTSSNCLIENNIFQNLRHSVLLQSGAIGNVVSGNYSANPFWKEGLLPENSAGEIVLHGNYPSANLFEGNHVGNIVIDNSHGLNGPNNVFFRNKAELWGVVMNENAGHSTHFIANEFTGIFQLFTGTGNIYLYNDINAVDTVPMPIIKSLYLTEPPNWWPLRKPFPCIGKSYNNNFQFIPAKYRFLHDSMRALFDDSNNFIANLSSNFSEQNHSLLVSLKSNLQLNISSLILEKYNYRYKEWFNITPNLTNNTLFQEDVILDTIPLANELSCYRWYAKGYKNQFWMSDSFCIDNRTSSMSKAPEPILCIYPNPTSEYLHLTLLKKSNIKLYSVLGELLFEKSFEKGKCEFSISHLPPSNYIVEINNNDAVVRRLIQKK